MLDLPEQRSRRAATLLTFLGTVPFVAAAVYTVVTSRGWHARYIAGDYGIVIISFLAGVEWGTYLARHERSRLNLLVISNIFALAAWACLLTLEGWPLLAAEACLFAAIFAVDVYSSRAGLIPTWFLKLRLSATLIVEASLLTLIASSLIK